MWQLFCIPLVSCFLAFCQLVWDPLYGDFSCMQVWARNLKTNVVGMYASCTFSLCVLHRSSCNLMLTVITDVSFVAFKWSAASWIMFSAYPAYMEVTCPAWCYYDLLHSLYKYCVKQCETHLDFSRVMFWFLFMNAGYYIISDLNIFHLPFYSIILWNRNIGGTREYTVFSGQYWWTSDAKSRTGALLCLHIHSVQQLLTCPMYNPVTCMAHLESVAKWPLIP